jgi:predicted TPR repeat methyltransferase
MTPSWRLPVVEGKDRSRMVRLFAPSCIVEAATQMSARVAWHGTAELPRLSTLTRCVSEEAMNQLTQVHQSDELDLEEARERADEVARERAEERAKETATDAYNEAFSSAYAEEFEEALAEELEALAV